MLLAIDTATDMAGVAVYDKNQVWGEETWYSPMSHTVELMPRIVRMLESAKQSAGELEGIAVSLGPGSFTGLRIGVSLAKGLALPNGVPLVGVPTLDIVAYPHRHDPSPLWAVIQAGRGRLCAACYRELGGAWQQVMPPFITTLEGLVEKAEMPARFVGEIDAPIARFIMTSFEEDVEVVSPAFGLRRPGILAEMAYLRLYHDEADDIATLSPIYLHHPSIDG